MPKTRRSRRGGFYKLPGVGSVQHIAKGTPSVPKVKGGRRTMKRKTQKRR